MVMISDKFIVFNGELILSKDYKMGLSNRAFRFGDSIFETIRVFNGRVVFIKEHIDRLFSSLRVVNMVLPDYFTSEFLERKIVELIDVNKTFDNKNARIRLTVFRKADSNIYFVDNDNVDFVLEYSELNDYEFIYNSEDYNISVFEDISKSKSKLSQIKTNNMLLHIIAGAKVKKDNLDNILLINDEGNLTEAINANVFIVKGNVISTPKLSDGCVDGILKKVLKQLIQKHSKYKIEERRISKDELPLCDEVFLTNTIIGIQPVTKYREKCYSTEISSVFLYKLNEEINSRMDQKVN